MNKKKSIFIGKRVIKKFEVIDSKEDYLKPYIVEKTEVSGREKILELDLDFEFNVKEEIYLEELNKYTTIEKKTVSTKGNIIYNITYVIESIIDEESKSKAEKTLQDLLNVYNKKHLEIEKKSIEIKEKDEKESEEYRKLLKEKLDSGKIRKIVINNIPLNKDGKPIVDPELAKKYTRAMICNLPFDTIVITTPFNTRIYDLSNTKDVIEEIAKLELKDYKI